MKVEDRQAKQQQLLLRELAKTPIVDTACQRVGIGRATYYRWRADSTVSEDDAWSGSGSWIRTKCFYHPIFRTALL